MSFPYYAQVERAHAELVASGQITRRDNQEATEHDKGLLTRRAGYYANQKDPSIGLLEKTSGNNAMGFSVDILVEKPGGRFWDVATDNAGLAMPVNGEAKGPDPELALRWRQPTAALAGLDGPTPPDPKPPMPPGDLIPVLPFDDAKAVEFGMACNRTYAESGAAPDAGMISVHSQRCAYSYYVTQLPWPVCLKKHTNEFRAEYGLPPLP